MVIANSIQVAENYKEDYHPISYKDEELLVGMVINYTENYKESAENKIWKQGKIIGINNVELILDNFKGNKVSIDSKAAFIEIIAYPIESIESLGS